MTAKDITDSLLALEDERQREVLLRFFKTGKGEYGEGDKFLGIRVPEVRLVAKTAVGLPLRKCRRCCRVHGTRCGSAGY